MVSVTSLGHVKCVSKTVNIFTNRTDWRQDSADKRARELKECDWERWARTKPIRPAMHKLIVQRPRYLENAVFEEIPCSRTLTNISQGCVYSEVLSMWRDLQWSFHFKFNAKCDACERIFKITQCLTVSIWWMTKHKYTVAYFWTTVYYHRRRQQDKSRKRIGVGAQSTLGGGHFCPKIYTWKN